MKPSYDELLAGNTRWRHDLDGVTYLLSFHGYRADDPQAVHPEGIWCYYLLIPEQMFAHRWDDFAVTRKESGFEQPGPGWDHDWFDSEITWSSSEPQWCRGTERLWDSAKIGCDYAHLWHSEQGYPDTYESVMLDAQSTVKKFLEANPDRQLKSGYSYRWGVPEEFWVAHNGRLLHEDDKPDPKWGRWQRAHRFIEEPSA